VLLVVSKFIQHTTVCCGQLTIHFTGDYKYYIGAHQWRVTEFLGCRAGSGSVWLGFSVRI